MWAPSYKLIQKKQDRLRIEMGNALQDQLLNMGLVDKKKAAQAKKDKYKKNKKQQKTKQQQVDENKLIAQQAMQEKKQQDRLLNLEKEKLAQEKAIQAQIKQLVDLNKLSKNSGEISFNFQDGKNIKNLLVSQQVHEHLTQGQLAIAKSGNKYEIIPKVVAEKITQRDASSIILLNEDVAEEVDDFYSDYEIPDDLMW